MTTTQDQSSTRPSTPNRPQTFSEMFALGEYECIIGEEYLPKEIDPSRFTAENTRLFTFPFPDDVDSDEVIEAMAKEGYVPATIETLLAYRVHGQMPKCKRYMIMALGTSTLDPDFDEGDEYFRAPCLKGGSDKLPWLNMFLVMPGAGWTDDWVRNQTFMYFLAVRKQ